MKKKTLKAADYTTTATVLAVVLGGLPELEAGRVVKFAVREIIRHAWTSEDQVRAVVTKKFRGIDPETVAMIVEMIMAIMEAFSASK